MKSLKLILMGSVSSLFLSSNIYSNNISYLYDVLPESARGDFELSFSKAEFNENLDVLGYIDNLTGARPKQADITELSLSYRVLDKYRLTLQTNDSFAEVTRSGIPSSIETEAKTDFISFSFPVLETKKNVLNLEIFYTETEQDPLTIDCYGFGSIVVADHALKLTLNSWILKFTEVQVIVFTFLCLRLKAPLKVTALI